MQVWIMNEPDLVEFSVRTHTICAVNDWNIFTALHGMQTRSSDENSVCPSVCYKVSLCENTENCRQHNCKAFIGLTIRAKMIGGEVLFCVKIWCILTHPLSKRQFSMYFRCSASAITPSEKSSINTNRKSTMCFSMSQSWTSYVVRKPPPQGGLKNAKCPKFEQ